MKFERTKKKIQTVKEHEGARKSEERRLLAHTGMILLKPQMLVNLTPVEEQARCELTWQLFDEAMWRVAFAEDQELRKVVARVQDFKNVRENMVILALDQVPFRAKLQGGRQLYCPDEMETKDERKRRREEG